MVFFAEQNLSGLNRFRLFVSFCFLCLRKQIQTNMANIYVSVLPMCVLPLFCKSFIVFNLASLVCLEFIFVYYVRECFNFTLLYATIQFSQHHLLKRLFFPPLYIFFLLS